MTPEASSASPIIPSSLAPDVAAAAALNQSDVSLSHVAAAGNGSANGNFITPLSDARGVPEEQLAHRAAAIFNKAPIAVFPTSRSGPPSEWQGKSYSRDTGAKGPSGTAGESVEIQ